MRMPVHLAILLHNLIQPWLGIRGLVKGLVHRSHGVCDLEFDVALVVPGFCRHLKGYVRGVVLLVQGHVATMARAMEAGCGVRGVWHLVQALVLFHYR